MAEIIKETIVTQDNSGKPVVKSPVVTKATGTQTIEYLVYFLFGFLEILLAFRFVLKLTGANVASGFVNFIYSLSGIFILPFSGIFSKGYAEGLENTSVFEPATLVALVVYLLVAWGIVKLVKISSGEKQES